MNGSPSKRLCLSPALDRALHRLVEERSLRPPDMNAYEALRSLPDEDAMAVLAEIASGKISNISASIILGVRNHESSRKIECLSFTAPLTSKAEAIRGDGLLGNLKSSNMANMGMPVTNNHSLEFRTAAVPMVSEHLSALGELEFRKVFLLLSYIGERRLEDVISVHGIHQLRDLDMFTFESQVRRAVGADSVADGRLKQNFDWDTSKTHQYHCLVDHNGKISFKGPFLHTTTNLFQRVLGDDNVLLVRFAESENHGGSPVDVLHSMNVFRKLAADGISVGLRLYRFFDSSASSDRLKPYILSHKSIQEARMMFMHVHTVSSMSKYMARFSLILSKTVQLDIDLGSVNIEIIDDILCLDENGLAVVDENGEPLIHSDGTGFISEDLAFRCPRDVVKGLNKEEKDLSRRGRRLDDDLPLLIQYRLFYMGYAIKGTALVNKTLPPRAIQVRQSMVKVNQDRQRTEINSSQICSFEIVSTSVRPKKTFLSRYLITLLSYGGVPRDFFIELVRDALHDAKYTRSDPFAALKVALKYHETSTDLIRMLLAGIPLDEPYLHCQLSFLAGKERKQIKEGKVYIPDCFYLMGTVDPTGKLRPDQICIIMDHGQVTGDVLVYKHPGLHFGDIHIFSATYVKELKDFVGNSKFAIFFPAQGPRSAADEIANSDFDGDMYWISQNSKLLSHFRASRPWERPPSIKPHLIQPCQLSEEKLEQTLFDAFLVNRFHPSNTVSVAADSWLAFMDRLLTLGDECEEEKKCLECKMLRLTNIFYHALDAPKTGIKVEVPKDLKADRYPHFMERDNSYISTSILGQIYDEVMSSREDDQPAQGISLLPCFTEEVPEDIIILWTEHYRQYRVDMSTAMTIIDESKDAVAEAIISKYKEILYDAAEYDESTKPKEQIFVEARAIYQIVYAYVMNGAPVVSYATKNHASAPMLELNKIPHSRCQFVWKVAGAALCDLYARLQNRQPVLCLPAVLNEMINGRR